MINTPAGWASVSRGDEVIVVPPRGIPGHIVYVERRRPVHEPHALVDLHVPRHLAASQPKALITDEGEYGLFVRYTGTGEGGPVHGSHAFVIGDDFYAHTAGTTTPEHARLFDDAVCTLARTDVHMLGVRRRRFLHTPPAGWSGQRVAIFHTRWRPEDASDGELWAYAAVPSRDVSKAEVLRTLLSHGGVSDPEAKPYHVQASAGPGGEAWELTDQRRGEPRTCEIAILEDATYLYPLRIEYPRRRRVEMCARFAAVVKSVMPLPGPRMGAGQACTDLASQWLS